ncbi:B- and T-lymphocyte attenuator [Oreochromis aureus]|uniref:Ig-like domain-containing protein n=1 Tax=Oreochromis aureus TaxID=47969 RepID=A0A668U1L2_OREAU|nr:B- and T-lymphocyte attenuator [Oreochromis aureus]
MLSLKDKLNYLIIFCCCVFVSIHGSGKEKIAGLHAPCEVEIMVRRGSTWKTLPRQSLKVSCPVKHCGETLEITWCKFLDSNNCERIHETKNVEITQNPDEDKLISYLHFKEISIHDDGQYRCRLLGYNISLISHSINISVSDMYQGVENTDNNNKNAGTTPSPYHSEDKNWRPYFYICFGIVLLILILTAFIFLSSYDWKRVLTLNYVKGEEMPTHMIPDLPKWSPPSTPVPLTSLSVLNDIYSSYTPDRSVSPASQPCSNQISASNPADKYQDCEVYGIIKHRHATKQGGKYHTMTNQVKNPESSITAERPESPPHQPHEYQISASNLAVRNEDYATYAVINHGKPAGKQHTVPNQVKNPEYAVIKFS